MGAAQRRPPLPRPSAGTPAVDRPPITQAQVLAARSVVVREVGRRGKYRWHAIWVFCDDDTAAWTVSATRTRAPSAGGSSTPLPTSLSATVH